MNVVRQASQSDGNLSDEVLEAYLKLALEGDIYALDEVVRGTHRLVRKIAAPLLPASSVDDAVQETYLVVIQKLSHLRHPAAFRGWLCRIALHVCYGMRRRARPTESLDPEQAVHDPTTSSGRSLDLRSALEALSQSDRDILILREYLGLSYEELADALDLMEGTVRSRLFTARKRLKALLEKGAL
jgi:RNA polymerase sigma-70 factor (ECF subfamily)